MDQETFMIETLVDTIIGYEEHPVVEALIRKLIDRGTSAGGELYVVLDQEILK